MQAGENKMCRIRMDLLKLIFLALHYKTETVYFSAFISLSSPTKPWLYLIKYKNMSTSEKRYTTNSKKYVFIK